MATKAQQANALTTYFEKAYEGKYGFKPGLNRYSARWGFDAILGSMPPAEAQDLIDYYFQTQSQRNHDVEWFFYNYDKLAKAKENYDADAIVRAKIRAASEQRVKEWKKTIGKSPDATD